VTRAEEGGLKAEGGWLLRGRLDVWSCAHHANPYITGVSWAPILPDAVRWGRAASSYVVISRGMSCVLVECPGSMSTCNMNAVAG
jgi:hypothetical protein